MINELSANYLTEGVIDFEYKKYMLLGYLKHVSQNFDEQKLYPFLSDLIFHYQNFLAFRQKKDHLEQGFPKRIKFIDLENFRIEYERVMHDLSYLDEIEAILDFAIPRIKESLDDGKEIYDFIAQYIAIEPIGIMPLHVEEGYLLFCNGDNHEIGVFNYAISIFESSSEKYRSLKTHFLRNYNKQFSNTFEAIKLDLIRQNKHLPNPATFSVNSRFTFPLQETLLPIAKRSLMRLLTTQH